MHYSFQGEENDYEIRVLHVDDEDAQRELTKIFLKEYAPNINLVSLDSPLKALDIALTDFDCILSDYSMPQMTGIEFAKEVKTMCSVPFILYTGKGSEKISAEAYAVGIDSYQRKENNNSHFQVLANRIKNLVEKSKAVNQLRESNETSFELINNFPSGLFIYHLDKDDQLFLTWGNSEAQRITGLDLKESIGREFNDIWTGPEAQNFKEILLACLGKRKQFKSSKYFFSQYDCEGYLNINTFPLSGARIVISLENINESVKYEHRLEALLNHCLLLDNANSVQEIAEIGFQLVRETLGYNSGRLYLKSEHSYVEISKMGESLLDEENLSPIALEVFRTGETQKRSTSNISDIELAIPVILDDSVKAILVVKRQTKNSLSAQDIYLVEILSLHLSSAMRRISELERLERQVAERTQKLLDGERLVTAGKIISMMGHDLRNPLHSMLNYIHLLKTKPEGWEKFLERIEDSIHYSIKILEDLQSLTKDAPIRRFPVDLSYLIRQSIDANQIPEKVCLNINIDSRLAMVQIDPVQIRRVLDNLISNAIDAMPEGGELTISCEKLYSSMLLKVSDSGIGIPSHIQPVIFELFRTSKPNGTGLGLAFCKRAVEAHNGVITVKSTPNEGTDFLIEIPL